MYFLSYFDMYIVVDYGQQGLKTYSPCLKLCAL